MRRRYMRRPRRLGGYKARVRRKIRRRVHRKSSYAVYPQSIGYRR